MVEIGWERAVQNRVRRLILTALAIGQVNFRMAVKKSTICTRPRRFDTFHPCKSNTKRLRQKFGSWFRHPTSVKFNQFNWILHGRTTVHSLYEWVQGLQILQPWSIWPFLRVQFGRLIFRITYFQGDWLISVGGWAVHRASWIMCHASWVVPRGLCNEGCAMWVVGHGSCVVCLALLILLRIYCF